jgi:hypothetical protein
MWVSSKNLGRIRQPNPVDLSTNRKLLATNWEAPHSGKKHLHGMGLHQDLFDEAVQ